MRGINSRFPPAGHGNPSQRQLLVQVATSERATCRPFDDNRDSQRNHNRLRVHFVPYSITTQCRKRVH